MQSWQNGTRCRDDVTCKDSENDGHNAAMRTSRVHWVLKMFINQILFCVVVNCKHISTD